MSQPIGRGSGRGQLIKSIIESARSSSDEQSKNPKPDSPMSRRVLDSGLGTESQSPQTLSPAQGRGSGRGFIRDLISISSQSDTSSAEIRPVGRAQFISAMRALASKAVEPAKETAASAVVAPDEDAIVEDLSLVKLEVEQEAEPIIKRGTKGRPVSILSNYIRLKTEPNTGVFEYEVRFVPNIHSMGVRYKILNQHKNTIGNTRTFDGTVLYLPIQLPDQVTVLTSVNENDNTSVELKIIFKRKKRLADCVHLYNVLFDRIMKLLNFVRMGRKQFDPTAPKLIPQHKLEVWPGYVTAVDEYEDGVMLCLDVSHRVLCQTTVLELMAKAYRSDQTNFQKNVLTALLGAVVLTRYNNRSYRIDDIKFDACPLDTFVCNGKEINYIEYYKSQYNINIIDQKQPLLIHQEERRISGKTEKETITFCLLPEICYLTGLTDEMRSDFKVMRDIATYTKISPNQRVDSLNKFCKNLNATKEATEILKNWGLSLENSPIDIQGRQLDYEDIIFARKTFSAGDKADFQRHATANEVLEVVNITNWIVMYTNRDTAFAKKFVELMERNSAPMGIHVSKPRMEVLDADKTELYVQKLRQCINKDLQIVVIICPTSRDDRYAAIKKVCCSELPMPSQVINSRTLSNDAKNRSIVQKIALQMNCKLGGSLWSINIPFKNVMICGIDTFHDAAKKANSVSAFVASINGTYTKWYSRAVIQNQKEELINGLCISMTEALKAYKNNNKTLPEKIIIYRDGVGDGQLKMCNEYEIPQLQAACARENPDYAPLFTFIVVQKRINSRMFAKVGNSLENPKPGCVVDNTITRRFMYDFFLVPQSVREGTVTPTHYVVVSDSANFSPDILQRLSYKLCFLYYNWPGTVRVPACCQYAHKLAFLVGQSIKRTTSDVLAEKLFYL